MRRLTDQLVLQIWEKGQHGSSAQKAIAILQSVYPKQTSDELNRLNKGARDALLLSIRQHFLGSMLSGWFECQACCETLEVTFDIDEIGLDFSDLADKENQVKIKDYLIRYRLPNSLDLHDAARQPDVEQAYGVLLEHCIVQANRKGKQISPKRIPKTVLAQVQKNMLKLDPGAEIILHICCNLCGVKNAIYLDVASYFWREISAHARKLMYQVHALAGYYGWSERDILRLSAARRGFYLEMMS